MINKVSSIVVSIIISTATAYTQDDLPRYIESKDHSIMITVDAQTVSPNIILKWASNDLVLKYEIYRKELQSNRWGKPIAILEGIQDNYTDKDIQIGIVYEYQIVGLNFGSLIFRLKDKEGNPYDSSAGVYFNSFGYAIAGIEVGPFDNNGVALILLDETLETPEFNQLFDEYEYELMRDGWGVIRKYAPRAENFDKNKVSNTKLIIASEKEDDPHNIKTLIMFGRIAVAYSGDFAPDGHSDHMGAWPADMYYGNFEEFLWTDFLVNNISASRKENHNIPNDGRFDRSYLDNEAIDMQIGRVDFYNLPAFKSTEKDLLKYYIEKNMRYRRGEIPLNYRGLVSDNFPTRNYEEGFASSGWRNLASLLGYENVSELNWPQTLTTENYLWAYGCGSGYYNFADHIGNTEYMASTDIRAIFTMLLGSYFGDWDSRDNLLRSAIASSPSILTSSWAGRPHWYYHQMALGLPIGYSTRLSMNNFNVYKPYRYYFKGLDSLPSQEGKHKRGVHIALMGDPTLRMYLNEVPPLNSINITTNGSNVKISWNLHQDTSIKYTIYKAQGNGGHFARLNKMPQRINEFIDDNPIQGLQYYLVKPVKLIKTNGGLVYYTGRGAFQKFTFVNIAESKDLEFNFKAFPNPAHSYLSFKFLLPKPAETSIDIIDFSGKPIKTIYYGLLGATEHQFIMDLNEIDFYPGIYFAKINAGQFIKVIKFVFTEN